MPVTKKYLSMLGSEDFSSLAKCFGMAPSLGAELFGTFIIIFLGCGCAINFGNSTVDLVRISLGFGLGVFIGIQVCGPISGAHLNPAVSLGLALTRRCSVLKAMANILAQCLGAIVGALCLYLLTPAFKRGNLGSNALWNSDFESAGETLLSNPISNFPNSSKVFKQIVDDCMFDLTASGDRDVACMPHTLINESTPTGNAAFQDPTFEFQRVTPIQGFGIEMITTLFLVLVVLTVTDPNSENQSNGSPALAIGLTVTVCHLLAIPYTGCGLNPARSLGPALVSSSWQDHWLYWAGPFSGSIIAAILNKFILVPNQSVVYNVAQNHLTDEELNKIKMKNII